MIICGCAIEAKYQLQLTEDRKNKPIYIKNRTGKYIRKQEGKNAGSGKQGNVLDTADKIRR